MRICHCMGVSDVTIREAVDAGARHVDAVGSACGAGTMCGGCRPAIADLLIEEGAPVVAVRLREAVHIRPRPRVSPNLA